MIILEPEGEEARVTLTVDLVELWKLLGHSSDVYDRHAHTHVHLQTKEKFFLQIMTQCRVLTCCRRSDALFRIN